MSKPLTTRPTPCASCPYRKNVPSGIWEASEYDKLPAYDAPTGEQPIGVFCCHSDPDKICSGWLAYKDPHDLLAVRIGISMGALDPDEVLDYTTSVELFSSGAEAAEHGMRDIEEPDVRARRAVTKLIRQREVKSP